MRVIIKNHDTDHVLFDGAMSAVPDVGETVVAEGGYWHVFRRRWHLHGNLAGSVEVSVVHAR